MQAALSAVLGSLGASNKEILPFLMLLCKGQAETERARGPCAGEKAREC